MVFGPLFGPAMVDSVSVRFKNARVEKVLLNIGIQWNAGSACVPECVLKTLWRVGVCVSALLSSIVDNFHNPTLHSEIPSALLGIT